MSILKCCENAKWVNIADIGHAYSFDFILGKCSVCGEYWANIFCTATAITGYEKVQANDAEYLLKLNNNHSIELKTALKSWLDENI